MRSINTTLHGLLDEKVHSGHGEILMMKSFMILQSVYVLCFAMGSCSLLCKVSMRLIKKGSLHWHTNAATAAC